MKYIEKSWESYRKLVIPANAPDIQVKESRQAFFAGASIIFEGMIKMMDGGDEPTPADMQRMANIQAEIDAFGQSLDRQILGKTEH